MVAAHVWLPALRGGAALADGAISSGHLDAMARATARPETDEGMWQAVNTVIRSKGAGSGSVWIARGVGVRLQQIL